MKLKAKRHIILPVALLIYIAVMAFISFPKYKESGDWNEFLIILAICIALAALLFFILKRKENLREKFKKKDYL